MQLKTHEDTKAGSECKLLFQFDFKMLAQKKRDYLKDFDWDVNYEPSQRLYLSQDTKRLMEVINNFTATVYTRVDMDARIGDEISRMKTWDRTQTLHARTLNQ